MPFLSLNETRNATEERRLLNELCVLPSASPPGARSCDVPGARLPRRIFEKIEDLRLPFFIDCTASIVCTLMKFSRDQQIANACRST
eukprot:2824920-Prymnesium_polylepis.2